jgi:hypothetical protein
MQSRAVTALGFTISAFSVVFIFFNYVSGSSFELESLRPTMLLLLAAAAMLLANIVLAIIWASLLAGPKSRLLSQRQLVEIHMESQILKYFPLLPAHLLRRHLSTEAAGSHNQRLMASLIELGIVISGSASIAMFAFWAFTGSFLFGAIGVLILLGASFSMRKLAQRALFTLSLGLVSVVVFSLSMCLIALGTVDASTVGELAGASGAMLIAWICGTLVPGAPGGIGPREVVFLVITDGFLDPQVGLQIVVLWRFVGMSADGLTSLAGMLMRRVGKGIGL